MQGVKLPEDIFKKIGSSVYQEASMALLVL